MPELPEVETVCRGLNQLTQDRVIRGGEVLLKRTLAYPDSLGDFWAGLTGSAIAHWQRRGKYLLAQLVRSASPAGWLGVHLRMSGQLLWLPRTTPLQKHTRVRLFLGSEQELRFVDQRTFGQMWWVPPALAPETIITGLQKLGPEPFSPDFSATYLQQELDQRRCSIKAALLDQHLVAGVGNIYADEALFKSGLRPDKPAGTLSFQELERLRTALISALQAGIEQGGTTFSSFQNLLGVNGNYSGQAWVYGREGDPCRVCRTPIQRQKLAGRSAHFCPHCQR